MSLEARKSPVLPASPPSTSPASPQAATVDGYGCFVRLCWMLIGNALMAILAIQIARHPGLGLSLYDALFWGTAGAAVLLRRLDVVRFHGQTASGAPATLAHWRRYVLMLIGVCAVAWLAAHAAVYMAVR